jgi:hypothetical protein
MAARCMIALSMSVLICVPARGQALVEGDRRPVAASMSQALFGPGSATVAPNMAPNSGKKAPSQRG